jgi:hypothetical protein
MSNPAKTKIEATINNAAKLGLLTTSFFFLEKLLLVLAEGGDFGGVIFPSIPMVGRSGGM